MTAVVFVGPSVDLESARQELDADFRPPVARGDIDAVLGSATRPTVIGIIDGRFLQSLCLSPKEVLRAIDAGIAVFGASSMGALRAVECAPYGMVGVGRIFGEFASGRVDSDDEVAVAYDEHTGRALSEPLINWRLALAAGVAAGAVTPDLADRFLTVAKRIYFPQRTVRAVLDVLAVEVGAQRCERLATYLRCEAPDAKREDALLMLREIRRIRSGAGGAGGSV